MKKLISLLASGLLAISPLASQETQKDYFVKLGIPERFENYREGASRNSLMRLREDLFAVIDYDINGDNKSDVQEIYRIIRIDEFGIPYRTEEPLVYGFDINRNGNCEEEGETMVFAFATPVCQGYSSAAELGSRL